MNWWREHYECWARQQSIARVEQAVNETRDVIERYVFHQMEREVLVACEPQQFGLLTIAGHGVYHCPPEVTRVDELWVEDIYRYLLHPVGQIDFARAQFGTQARPTIFLFYNQHLHFYPIPDREYRIGFIQHDRGSNYAELSRITREAFARRMAPIAPTVTNKAYYAARDKSLALL